MHRFLSYASTVLFAAVLAVGLASCDGADNAWAGKYETMDTQGKPMTITLAEDGSASGTRENESLTGSWKDDGGSAMVTWSDDWATKIEKDGDSYTKTGYKGGTADGEPVAAKKVE